MDDALLVRRFERFSDLFGNRQRFIDGQRALRDALGQRRAFHQLHDDGVVFESVDRGDVGMIQRRQHLRFSLETRQVVRIVGERRGQDLDGHVAV
jgi:hypothetical protein